MEIFVATDQNLTARYCYNDYLLPMSPLHYKGCALLFCYTVSVLSCSIHVRLSPESLGINKSLYIKSVDALFHGFSS